MATAFQSPMQKVVILIQYFAAHILKECYVGGKDTKIT